MSPTKCTSWHHLLKILRSPRLALACDACWAGACAAALPALAIFLVSIWLLYDTLSSDRFIIRIVRAEGNQALTEDDVRELAAVTEQSVWVLDAKAVEANVARSPYVERVRAQVQLPDTVLVQVSERRPEVRWTHSGTTYDVTWDGLILAGSQLDALGLAVPSPAASPGGPEFVSSIAIVDTTPNRTLKPGDYVDRDALEVARRVSLRAAELPSAMQRIEWDAGLGVSLILGENRQVVLGKPAARRKIRHSGAAAARKCSVFPLDLRQQRRSIGKTYSKGIDSIQSNGMVKATTMCRNHCNFE